MILTDGIHLVSDSSLEELHRFAKKVGLKRQWFQYRKYRGSEEVIKMKYPHYDLTTIRKFNRVLEAGVAVVSSKELVNKIRGVKFE